MPHPQAHKDAYDMIDIAAKVLKEKKPAIKYEHDSIIAYQLWYDLAEAMSEKFAKAYPMIKAVDFMKRAGFGG